MGYNVKVCLQRAHFLVQSVNLGLSRRLQCFKIGDPDRSVFLLTAKLLKSRICRVKLSVNEGKLALLTDDILLSSLEIRFGGIKLCLCRGQLYVQLLVFLVVLFLLSGKLFKLFVELFFLVRSAENTRIVSS